jgi:hypothetical protein
MLMTDLHIEQSPNAPKVDFLAKEGLLSIEGRSIPENPGDFYKPLIHWAQEYFKSPNSLTTITIKLEYINSGSSKSLLEFFRYIKEQHSIGHQCIVKWHAEDDDESVQELGEHYQYTLKIPFEFIKY